MPPILKAIRGGNISPAEEWVFANRMQLGRLATYDLTFDIARIRYTHLLCEPYSEAQLYRIMSFAQQRLSVFHAQYDMEIRPLLHLLLFYGTPTVSLCLGATSPESHSTTINPILTAIKPVKYYESQLGEKIMMHCAKINDLPGDGIQSNFEILLAAGGAASLIVEAALKFVDEPGDELKTAQLSSRKKSLFDLESSGLPVDFKIKPEQRYHSVFCCPVSRQPATAGDPPVLLECGHAILMSSMKSLPRRGNTFKCPTCYSQSQECKVITLII